VDQENNVGEPAHVAGLMQSFPSWPQGAMDRRSTRSTNRDKAGCP
jgi:hypothetical protein